jgi:capsular polysaccharide biosynthesis protein
MERETVETRTVSLGDLWKIFLQRFWLMAIAAVIAMGAMVVYVKLTFVPLYKSTATVYILSADDETEQSKNNDFILALNLVTDCEHILRSHAVLDQVSAKMTANPDFKNKTYKYESLKSSITTNNPEDSRILEVTVTAASPAEAKAIVDYICDIGAVKIQETMHLNQVNVLEYGTLSKSPCNITSSLSYLLAGFVAAVAVYVIFLIIFLFDDRIRDNEGIEKILNLSVLGNIPDASSTKKSRYGYYKRYYRARPDVKKQEGAMKHE